MVFLKRFFFVFLMVALGTPWVGAKKSSFGPKYAAIVMEAKNGAVLHSQDAHSPRHPASITKIMTLFLLFEALESKKVTLRTKLPISARAAKQPPCKLGLKPGSTISVKDALLGMVTKSANDASVVVAEYLGGSEERFAQLMTQKARALGMQRTTFKNAHGLHNSAQVTTAHDMAVLGREVYRRYPRYYTYFRTQAFWYNGQRHHNHNKLLGKFHNVDGIKTGFTNPSGFTLVASAQRGGRRLVAVILGGQSGPSRDRRMAELLETAFKDGRTPSLQKAGSPMLRRAVAKKIEDPLGEKIREVAHEKDFIAQTIRAVDQQAKQNEEDTLGHKIRTLEARAALPRSSATWSIQVGAFAKAQDAQKAARTHLAKLPAQTKAKISVTLAKMKKRRGVYQARLTGLTQSQATQACRVLEKMGQPCLVLRPRQESTLICAEHTP